MNGIRRRIGFVLGWLLIAGLALSVYSWFHANKGAPSPRHGVDAEFAPQVYVWQRAWTESVRRAVVEEGPAFGRMVVLARQIEFESGVPRSVRVAVDWPAIKGSDVAAAVRIGTFRGKFDGASAQMVAQSVREVVVEANAAAVALTEVQIDFDAATSKLAGYRQWLAVARSAIKEVGNIPVTFTALPTWLDSSAFEALAKDAGYFVLQVHWLDRPHNVTEVPALCDLTAARRAIDKAARLGIPFRVALPTYAYVAAFNADGSFAGLTAEGAPANWGQGKTLRLVESHPQELAEFVKELAANRPMCMRGVIWYRLPIDSDRLNWSWTTLQCVMAGITPSLGKLAVECEKNGDKLYDIRIRNIGQQDVETAGRVHVAWSGAGFLAADGLAGFEVGEHDDAAVELLAAQGGWQNRLKPGEVRSIGWVRLDRDAACHGSLDDRAGGGQPAGLAR